jgi:DNA-binding response OmpR family regulator
VKKRVLIVEDEVLVAMLVEELLERMGYEVAAVSSHIEEALELARTLDVDLAMLDINLNGKQSFPVAELLRERGIPFLFATGYGDSVPGSAFGDVPLVQKPFNRDALKAALEKL